MVKSASARASATDNVMTERNEERFRLAVKAVDAAIKVVARHMWPSGTLEIVAGDQFRALRNHDERLLRSTLRALNAVAGSPRLFRFRLLTAALSHSLPQTCLAQATAEDISAAASDLAQLAGEAQSLLAPDVAVTLTEIADAMLAQDTATRDSPTLH